jgi:tRNA 2-thiouridine synthesizing protein A
LVEPEKPERPDEPNKPEKRDAMPHADVKLDTLGYFCPMPIIMTLKKIKELTLGQVLEVVSDDEGIKKDMPAWCDTTGHQMVGLEEEQTKSGMIYKAFVRKTK